MRILFLTSRVNRPSFRFRVLQYLPYLKKNGWDIMINEIPRNWFRRQQWIRKLKEVDIIFIQRKLLGLIEIKEIKKKAKILCYDFDDALMYEDSSKGAVGSKRREKRFQSIIKTADIIIAGNEYLADKAGISSSRTTIIPTNIDTNVYFPINKKEHDKIILGWIGTKSTLIYLGIIEHLLNNILTNFKNVSFKVVCDDFSGLNIPDAIMKKWSIEEEVLDLQSFDIGLMPLSDDRWTRGKCGFKIIQYMAVGIPVVCSKVGANRKIITEGTTGFLAHSSEFWQEYLNQLIKSVELRRKMGQAGREFVKKNYSIDYWAPYLEKLLRKSVEEKK